MSDRQSATDLSDAAVGSALRGLPLATPPADAWNVLAASLRAQGLVRDTDATASAHSDDLHAATRDTVASADRIAHAPRSGTRKALRRRERRWLPAALAAGLALAAIALVPMNRDADAPPIAAPAAPVATAAQGVAANAGDEAELALLRGESGRIEEWLRLLKRDETPLDGRSLMAATEIEDMIGLIDLQLAAGNDNGNDARALWRNRVELLRDLAAVRTTYSLAGTGVAANGNAAAPDTWNNL